MIKENQQLFNRLHVISDGIFLFLSLPVAFWLRFYVLPNGIITVPLSQYMLLDIFLTAAQLFPQDPAEKGASPSLAGWDAGYGDPAKRVIYQSRRALFPSDHGYLLYPQFQYPER